jgi:hypothetical protein
VSSGHANGSNGFRVQRSHTEQRSPAKPCARCERQRQSGVLPELPRRAAKPAGKFGLKRAELNRVKQELSKALEHLCAEWRRIHGDF